MCELLDETKKEIALLKKISFNKLGTVGVNQASLRHHILKTKKWVQVLRCNCLPKQIRQTQVVNCTFIRFINLVSTCIHHTDTK